MILKVKLTQFGGIEVLSISYRYIDASFLSNQSSNNSAFDLAQGSLSDRIISSSRLLPGIIVAHSLNEILHLNLRCRTIKEGDRDQFNLIILTRDQTPSRSGGMLGRTVAKNVKLLRHDKSSLAGT